MTAIPDLRRLYDDHASALFGFLLNTTRNEADSRDVLQDVFVKLAARPGLLDGVADVRGFLIRMAHNLVIDAARRRSTRQRHHDRLEEGPELFEPGCDARETEFRAALAAALRELPPDQSAVVHLKLWENMTFEAIAAALSIPPNTAASRYRYGIDKLRDRLRPLYEEIKGHGSV
ncbi:MAG: sigma-70 family RNA polymerase sigma factor [Lentisphaerae bacterium]|nr:sigma-70 family RNA polymerase sigma factor [Lentisphaerota bacterium]